MKKSIPLTALLGAAPMAALLGAGTMVATTDASAAPVAATLVQVANYSNNGSATFNLSASTATWTFDADTGTAAIVSGTYYGEVLSPNVYGHTMTGISLGNFVPTLGTWSCQEGTFGGAVGASICGNYNFGSNKKNQSTYTPSALGATVTLGGDDANLPGGPQSAASSYSNMTMTDNGGGSFTIANLGYVCQAPTNPGPCSGYTFVFQTETPEVPAPAAVWLLGTGLAGLAARRLRKKTQA